MRRLLITLTAVLLCSFNLNLPLTQASQAGSTLVVAVDKDAPTVEFVVNADKVAIYQQNKEHKLLQEIPYSIPTYAEITDNELLSFEDMNFDGYMDVKIAASVGRANRYDDCWLWDKATQQFVIHEELSQLASPVFNPNIHTVRSFTHISATDSEEAVYIWEKGKLLPIQKLERSYSYGENRLIEREYRPDEHGKLQLVREQKVLPEEGMKN